MKLINGSNTHEFHVQKDNQEIGMAYIYEFLASKLYDVDRVNYYIHATVHNPEDIESRKEIVNLLIKKAKDMKIITYPKHDGRVYHCCLKDDVQNQEFYKSIDGFKDDEGMWILEHNHLNHTLFSLNELDYTCVEDNLNDVGSMEQFIIEHQKIFLNSPYTVEKIKELKNKQSLKSVGIYDADQLIANILLTEERSASETFGWVEDMFVSESYRRQGLAKHLLVSGLNYLKTYGYDKSRLEVWNTNSKANKLYVNHGFEYYEQTEVSIGMSI